MTRSCHSMPTLPAYMITTALFPATPRIALVTPPPIATEATSRHHVSNPSKVYAKACADTAAELEVSVVDPWHTLDMATSRGNTMTRQEGVEDAVRVIHHQIRRHSSAIRPNPQPISYPRA
ncbi:Aste57867_16547 [Aphanomyces stellatus]|uniref:Aste57867_16547 protein n=1 Tax=Aphanomyces stellatus TaxID=120398 RepID=A0A485L5X2_9STRA|nr:hypothetical protein As57867_016490 [Aphanomyces stellatus]VFT93321.1 Aste57867_16547 [Aphanomyces stellatus]